MVNLVTTGSDLIDQRSLMFYATTTKNCLQKKNVCVSVCVSVCHITFLSGYMCSDTSYVCSDTLSRH